MWVGNRMRPGSRCVTDGRILIYRSGAVNMKLYATLEAWEPPASATIRNVSDRLIAKRMKSHWLRGRAYVVELPGVVHMPGSNGFPMPHWTFRSGTEHAWVDDRLWDICRQVTAFDAVRWARKTAAPLRLMRKGKLVGVLMGLRPSTGEVL